MRRTYAVVKHRDIATNVDQEVSCDHFGVPVVNVRGMGSEPIIHCPQQSEQDAHISYH